MAGRTEDWAGHAPSGDKPPTARDPAAPYPADDAAPRAGAGESEAEKARAEIEAGDVADDLADFA